MISRRQGTLLGAIVFLTFIGLWGITTQSDARPKPPIAASERAVWAQTYGTKLLASNRKRGRVVTTASGLQYQVLKSGPKTGITPRPQDEVVAHYEGKTIDNVIFDSSYLRQQPAEFQVGLLIPGWIEALQLMRPGDVWKLWVPADLAYGAAGQPGSIGPNEVLIFQVELISIKGRTSPGSQPIVSPPGVEAPIRN